MKGIYAGLLAVGTGIVGLGIGAVAGGAIVGVGAAAGGAIGGSMLGICMTTDAALNSGLINEQQLGQLGTGIGQEIAQQFPEIAQSIKENGTGDLENLGNGQQPSAGCDKVIQQVLTQGELKQTESP